MGLGGKLHDGAAFKHFIKVEDLLKKSKRHTDPVIMPVISRKSKWLHGMDLFLSLSMNRSNDHVFQNVLKETWIFLVMISQPSKLKKNTKCDLPGVCLPAFNSTAHPDIFLVRGTWLLVNKKSSYNIFSIFFRFLMNMKLFRSFHSQCFYICDHQTFMNALIKMKALN